MKKPPYIKIACFFAIAICLVHSAIGAESDENKSLHDPKATLDNKEGLEIVEDIDVDRPTVRRGRPKKIKKPRGLRQPMFSTKIVEQAICDAVDTVSNNGQNAAVPVELLLSGETQVSGDFGRLVFWATCQATLVSLYSIYLYI